MRQKYQRQIEPLFLDHLPPITVPAQIKILREWVQHSRIAIGRRDYLNAIQSGESRHITSRMQMTQPNQGYRQRLKIMLSHQNCPSLASKCVGLSKVAPPISIQCAVHAIISSTDTDG